MSCTAGQAQSVCQQYGVVPPNIQRDAPIPFDQLPDGVVALGAVLADYTTIRGYRKAVLADLEPAYTGFLEAWQRYEQAGRSGQPADWKPVEAAMDRLYRVLLHHAGFSPAEIEGRFNGEWMGDREQNPALEAKYDLFASTVDYVHSICSRPKPLPIVEVWAQWVESWPEAVRQALLDQGRIRVCAPTPHSYIGAAWRLARGMDVPFEEMVRYPDLMAQYGV